MSFKNPLDPASARSAKVALAARLETIALGYVLPGWQVIYHKRLSGWCDGVRRIIKVPRPITRKAVWIFLHECAHAHLHADLKGTRKLRHVEEFEAETWALAKMREHGIAVPRVVMRRARAHVARSITKAERRGAERIDGEARKFAGQWGRRRKLMAKLMNRGRT
jgi:hypothetical protein